MSRRFTRTQTVTHLSTNPTVHGREPNSQPVDHKSDALITTLPSHCSDCECLTMNVKDAGGEWKTVGVERQRRERRFQEDVHFVHVDSALFQWTAQCLPTYAYGSQSVT